MRFILKKVVSLRLFSEVASLKKRNELQFIPIIFEIFYVFFFFSFKGTISELLFSPLWSSELVLPELCLTGGERRCHGGKQWEK